MNKKVPCKKTRVYRKYKNINVEYRYVTGCTLPCFFVHFCMNKSFEDKNDIFNLYQGFEQALLKQTLWDFVSILRFIRAKRWQKAT